MGGTEPGLTQDVGEMGDPTAGGVTDWLVVSSEEKVISTRKVLVFLFISLPQGSNSLDLPELMLLGPGGLSIPPLLLKSSTGPG